MGQPGHDVGGATGVHRPPVARPETDNIIPRQHRVTAWINGSRPDLVASVEGSRENWPLAQLFAASPEMLEALQEIVRACDESIYHVPAFMAEPLRLARAAIDKGNWHSQTMAQQLITVDEELARR